jgi:DHA1 family multidrug resistance protein-like MFS transporter
VSQNGWKRNLAVLWVAQTLTMIAFSFVFPFIPLYVKTMGVTGDAAAARWAGFIGLAAAVSMGLAQPFWGSVADRVGRRPMVIRSMVGSSVFVFLMGVAVSPGQLVVIRFLQGLVTGTVAASTALVATSTPKDKTGFALGALQMGFFVGSSVGPLVGGLIADALGFRAAFFIASAMQMTGAMLVFRFVTESFTRPATDASKPRLWASSRSLMALGVFPILLGVIFMATFGNAVVAPFLTLFVEQLHGAAHAATAAGGVFAAVGLVSALSALVLGKVSDRIGHAVLLPICVLAAALTSFPQAYVQSLWQLLAMRMALAVFLGGLMPSANALVANIVPQEQRGSAFGLTATAQCLANVVGPLSAIAIVTVSGMRSVFTISAALYVAAYAWVLVGFRRHAIGRFGRGTLAASSRRASTAPDERKPSTDLGSELAQPSLVQPTRDSST